MNASAAGQYAALVVRYGTGAPPVNGAAPTGTVVGQTVAATSAVASQVLPYSAGGIVTGLTPGVTYWVDFAMLSQSSSSGANYQGLTCTIMEF
jgi:hypothetical protein